MEQQTLNLKELVEFIDEPNIADEIDGQRLAKIADDVCKDYDTDWESMSKWCTCTEKGQDLLLPPTEGRSQPWVGASNYKSPIMQQAAYKFGERADRELLRPKNLVKTEVIGTPTDEKEKAADRVSTYQSYQVNHEIKGWRKQQRKLLYQLPNFGTIFKNTYFDRVKGHLVSEKIHWPNFAVNQATESVEDLPRFTAIREYDSDDIYTFQASGLWSDVELGIDKESDAEDQYKFLEQWTTIDLDGDGYGEPYVVTVHKQTKKVVRIYALYTREDITISREDEYVTLDTVFGPQSDEFGIIEDKNDDGEYEQVEDFDEEISGYEVVSIKRHWGLTMYGFMPSMDGTFLDVGYFQIMSALINAVNAGTNQIHDAATLNNLSGGYLAKGMRKKMGRDRFKPGVWKETQVSAQDLQTSMLPIPTKEPSRALVEQTLKYESDARQLSAAADIAAAFGPNTQATTVLAVLDESLSSTTALMSNCASSMSEEFQVMYKLNAIYMDPELYKRVIDDPRADYKKDFNLDNLDISATANPEFSNQTRRIQVAQVLMGSIDQLVANGANGREIVDMFLDAIAPDKSAEILPEPTEDFMAAQTAAQQSQQKASDAQAAWFTADAESKRARAHKDTISAQVDAATLQPQLENIKADTLKKLEEAETEQNQNMINTYTARLNGLDSTLEAIERMRNAETQDPTGNPENAGGSVLPFDGTPNLRSRIR